MPLTAEKLEKIKKADDLLARSLTQKAAAEINADVAGKTRAAIWKIEEYKAHTPQQIAELYTPEMEKLQARAERLKKIYDIYSKLIDLPQYKRFEGHPLQRFMAYEADASFDDPEKSPEDKQKIHQNNIASLEKLKDVNEQKNLRNSISKQLLETDFSPLLSGDPEEIIAFIKKNLRVCEYASGVNELIALFKDDSKLTDVEQKMLDKLIARRTEFQNYGGVGPAMFKLMASDYYPLLMDTGYEYNMDKVLNSIMEKGEERRDDLTDLAEDMSREFTVANGLKTLLDMVDVEGNPLTEAEQKQAVKAGKSILVHRQAREFRKLLLDDLGYDQKTFEKLIREKKISLTGNEQNMIAIGENLKDGLDSRLTEIALANSNMLTVRIIGEDENANEQIVYRLKWDAEKGSVEVLRDPQCITFCGSAAGKIIAKLKKDLDDAGNTLNDSAEYRKMQKALNDLAAELKEHVNENSYTAAKFVKRMERLAKAADDYYYAKLEDSHNERRGKRFEVAGKIQALYADLKIPKRPNRNKSAEDIRADIEKDLIIKYLKTDALAMSNAIKDKAHRAESMKAIKESPASRAAIYAIAGRINSGKPNEGWEKDTTIVLNNIFKKRTMDQLKSLLDAKGSEIRELVSEEMKEMKAHPRQYFSENPHGDRAAEHAGNNHAANQAGRASEQQVPGK